MRTIVAEYLSEVAKVLPDLAEIHDVSPVTLARWREALGLYVARGTDGMNVQVQLEFMLHMFRRTDPLLMHHLADWVDIDKFGLEIAELRSRLRSINIIHWVEHEEQRRTFEAMA